MGMAIRFSEEDVRAMGRTARGVRSINLKKDDDAVVGMVVVREDFPHLLSISEKGFGKRTGFDEYRVQGRVALGLSTSSSLRKPDWYPEFLQPDLSMTSWLSHRAASLSGHRSSRFQLLVEAPRA